VFDLIILIQEIHWSLPVAEALGGESAIRRPDASATLSTVDGRCNVC
jgi:hypothetical protein